MGKYGLLLILPLATSGLQCRPSEAPVLTGESHDHPEPAGTDDAVRLDDSTSELIGIKLAEVKARQSRSVLEAMAKVLAPKPQTAIVGHPFCARVSEVHAKIGEWVKAGQALVTLDSQEVGVGKSEFFRTTADLELAKLNFEREERLLEGGIGVKKNFVAAEAEYKIAQAAHEAAEKKLHVLGFTEEQVEEIAQTHQIHPSITLYAPIDGKVVASSAVLGALICESTEIMTIIDPTLLWVDAQIYEKDLAKVKVGQKVEITVPAYPEDVFHGVLSYIGDLVDEETRTITVRAEVSNEDSRLKPGMFADVTVVLNGGVSTLVVPVAAVLEEGTEQIVFVKGDEAFVRRAVQLGVIDGEYQQVLDGLEGGEEVVTEGNHLLRSKLREELLEHGHHDGHGQQDQRRRRRRGQ
jgi:cobalt-zinc-cadmium efflux system membrane fusion protein